MERQDSVVQYLGESGGIGNQSGGVSDGDCASGAVEEAQDGREDRGEDGEDDGAGGEQD